MAAVAAASHAGGDADAAGRDAAQRAAPAALPRVVRSRRRAPASSAPATGMARPTTPSRRRWRRRRRTSICWRRRARSVSAQRRAAVDDAADMPAAPALRAGARHAGRGQPRRLRRARSSRSSARPSTSAAPRAALNFADDPYLASRHARLVVQGGKVILRPLDAVNGVFVRVHELRSGAGRLVPRRQGAAALRAAGRRGARSAVAGRARRAHLRLGAARGVGAAAPAHRRRHHARRLAPDAARAGARARGGRRHLPRRRVHVAPPRRGQARRAPRRASRISARRTAPSCACAAIASSSPAICCASAINCCGSSRRRVRVMGDTEQQGLAERKSRRRSATDPW